VHARPATFPVGCFTGSSLWRPTGFHHRAPELALAHTRASWARSGGPNVFPSVLPGGFGIVVGIEAVHYTTKVGPSGDDFTGLFSIPGGLALVGLGLVTLWRTRRLHGSLPRRILRRGAARWASFAACPAASRGLSR
jgi:hypothetical protein